MTLTIQDLGALGELLGSVAVLVTLVYLSFQTRQNTMAISAQVDAARISNSIHLGLAIPASTEIMEALGEDRVGDVAINEDRRYSVWRAVLYNFQWQFVQGQRGLLPTFNAGAMARAVRRHFTNFGGKGRRQPTSPSSSSGSRSNARRRREGSSFGAV